MIDQFKFWDLLHQDGGKVEEKPIRLFDINRMSQVEDNDLHRKIKEIGFTTLTKQNPNNFYASSICTGNGQLYFILQVDLKKDGFL